jgi:hypothetical protein
MTRKQLHGTSRLCWIFLLAAGALCRAGTPASAEDCTLMKVTTVPLTIDAEGRVNVPVGINGAERHFLLSTATGKSNIDAGVADSLQLHQWRIKPSKEFYMAGAKALYFVDPPLDIGAAKINKQPLLVRPDSNHTPGIDGVLGADALDQFDLELNFAKPELTLFLRKHCSQQGVYWTGSYARVPFNLSRNWHAVIAATLDGKQVYAALDTSRGHTILSAQTAQERFGLTQNSPAVEPVLPVLDDPNVTGRLLFSHRFDLLDLGGVAVKHPLIYIGTDDSKRAFNDDHATDVRQHDAKYTRNLDIQELYIGMDVLRKLHLYIAYGEQAVYVSPASAEPAS